MGQQLVPRPPVNTQRGGGSQVDFAVDRPIHISPIPMEQNPHNSRLLNVGPKIAKSPRNTPLSAIKIDSILDYCTIKLPKHKWGITSLAFLDSTCRTTFLSWLIAERRLQTDPEMVTQ